MKNLEKLRFKVGNMRKYQVAALFLSASLLLAILWVAITTERNRDLTNSNTFIMYTIQHHQFIMVGLVVVSIAFGFIWSHFTFAEIKKRKKQSKGILDTVLLFLGKEEKQIINFLVEKNGNTSQAEISRLPYMNRVKAYRSLQKMQEKQLIEVVPHGKVRKVKLRDNIHDVLKES